MSSDEFFINLAIVSLPLLAIAYCCWCVTQIAVRRTQQNYRAQARKLVRILIVMSAISGVTTLVGAIPSILILLSADRHDEAIFFAGAYTVFGLLLSLATFPVFRVRSALLRTGDEDDRRAQHKIERSVAKIEKIGWAAVIAVVLVILCVLSFVVILLLALTLGLIPAIFWHRRRTREGQFLWLLAVSVRYDHDLAQEIEDNAATWRGSYAVRLRRLVVYLRDGRPLGESLSQVGGLLPRWVVSSIQIGETTGTLNDVLFECAMAQFKWMKERFRTGAITGLLLYLSCYLGAIVLPVTFLMYYIVPKYKAIFGYFETELPAVTEEFIHACDTWLPTVFLMTPFAMALVLVFLRFDHFGWRNVRVRIFRRFYPRYDASPILRHLGRMIRIGKTLPDSLQAIANSYHRPTVAEAVGQIYSDVEAGEDCWKGLLQGGFITQRDLALIEAAQRNGNLPWALSEIADLREKRFLFRVDTTCQLFRPIPVLAVGLLVGWICLAMFFPLLSLVNDLS